MTIEYFLKHLKKILCQENFFEFLNFLKSYVDTFFQNKFTVNES